MTGAAETDDEPPELLTERSGAVLIVTLNRPHRANALSHSLSRAIMDTFIAADGDPTVRAIVLTGAGERAFCAGHDLKARSKSDGESRPMPSPNRGAHRLMYEVVLETWKPTIAAINGAAMGGGLEIALACDLRLASAHAMLGLPEATRGMGALFGTVMLPRVAPAALAAEMMMTGQPITAQRAYEVGLVNRVCEPADLLPAALAMAQTIAANAPVTVRRMKETTVRASGMPLAAALRLNEGLSPYESDDRREGVRAFVEKRPPRWTGR